VAGRELRGHDINCRNACAELSFPYGSIDPHRRDAEKMESDAEEHREEFYESDFLSPRSRQANSMHAGFFLFALLEKVASPQQIYADCIS
jgi:hypothetical protein